MTKMGFLSSYITKIGFRKNPPAMQETPVGFLGWEDPLEKGQAIHSSIWPGEFHGLHRLQSHKESVKQI